jgi:hypothetical protein
MGSRFSLACSAQQLIARYAGRGAFCFISQSLRLIGQALVQWRGLLYTASSLHGTTPHSEGGIAAGVLLTDSCHGWCGDGGIWTLLDGKSVH